MLTITRLPGERLIFTLPDGRRASIEPRYNRGVVRLYCDFPTDVVIKREEIDQRPETCKG